MPASIEQPPYLLTPEEAGERLGLTGDVRRTVVRLANKGRLRAVPIGGFTMIDPASLDELVSVEDAAKRLGLDRASDDPHGFVLELIRRGALKAVRIGPFYRVTEASLRRLIQGK